MRNVGIAKFDPGHVLIPNGIIAIRENQQDRKDKAEKIHCFFTAMISEVGRIKA